MPFTVVGLGEVLWDLFPEGPQFGGAPANFACHAAMLGADASVVSRVGDDELGERAIATLRRHGVVTPDMGRSRDHATGTVRVELDAAGRPRFEIAEDVAWDHIPWSDDLGELARRADAVCSARNRTQRRSRRCGRCSRREANTDETGSSDMENPRDSRRTVCTVLTPSYCERT